MKRFWMTMTMLAVFCTAGLFLTGCNNKGGNAVAVVDLDAVAKAMGKDQVIAKQLQNFNTQINRQLAKVGKDLQKQLKAETKKIGSKPTEQDKKNLVSLQNKAEQKFAAYRQAGANRIRQKQIKLADDFRNEVKPYAERFARQRGASVVMVSTSMILWVDNRVDITADIIGAMRSASAAPIAPAPAPAPKP